MAIGLLHDHLPLAMSVNNSIFPKLEHIGTVNVYTHKKCLRQDPQARSSTGKRIQPTAVMQGLGYSDLLLILIFFVYYSLHLLK